MTDVRAQIEIELVDEVSARAKRVSSSLQQVDRASRAVGGATRTATAGADTARRATSRLTQEQRRQSLGLAQNVNLVSELALGFGNLSPATRQLGITFATAGNNAFALAGIFGPMGVAIGTLIGVVPGLIGLFQNLGDEAGSAADGMDRARGSFLSMIAAQRSARERQRESADLLDGTASSEAIGDAINVARRVLTNARGRERRFLREGTSEEQEVLRRALATEDPRALSADRISQIAADVGLPAGSDLGVIQGRIRTVADLRSRSFDEGTDDRAASSGVPAAQERLRRLERAQGIARSRESEEALDDRRQQAQQGVSLADEVLGQSLRSQGVANALRGRLRTSLSESDGSRVDLRGIDNPAVRQAAIRAALARQQDRVIRNEIQARTLNALDERLSGGRVTDGLEDPTLVEGGARGRGPGSRIVQARRDAPQESTIRLVVQSNEGIREEVFRLGDDAEFEIDARGPEDIGR
ncbi:MAG: hypothetical protein AAF411_18435 [Myxococcota bacterium]